MHACCVVTVQLQGIVGALRTLVAWQQQQQEAGVQQPLQPGKAGSSGKVAPSELHRQLFEERELTSQLQARIRQLQQELLLAGGPAVAATVPLPTSASVTPAPAGKQHVNTAARLARLSPGVGVHYSADASCVRALHVAPAALESAFAEVSGGDGALQEPAAVAVEPAACGADQEGADVLQGSPCCLAPEGHDTLAPGGLHAEPVVVQVSINGPDSSKAPEQEPAGASVQEQQQPDEGAGAAAATIAEQQQVIDGLQAQLTELQERLDASQREQLSFNSKWQSVKALVAAARCSTPSSQLSSSLTSPQPSFGPLEPVFGVSERSQPRTRSQCGLGMSTSAQRNRGLLGVVRRTAFARPAVPPACSNAKLQAPVLWQRRLTPRVGPPTLSAAAAAAHVACLSLLLLPDAAELHHRGA